MYLLFIWEMQVLIVMRRNRKKQQMEIVRAALVRAMNAENQGTKATIYKPEKGGIPFKVVPKKQVIENVVKIDGIDGKRVFLVSRGNHRSYAHCAKIRPSILRAVGVSKVRKVRVIHEINDKDLFGSINCLNDKELFDSIELSNSCIISDGDLINSIGDNISKKRK